MGNGKTNGQIADSKLTLQQEIAKAYIKAIPAGTIEQKVIDSISEAVIQHYDGKVTPAAEDKDFIKALGLFLLDNDGKVDSEAVKILRNGLIAYGYLMFMEEELVRHMASSRLVPGNTARQLIETIKEALGYEKAKVKETK